MRRMNQVDINCDMGEGFGAYTIGADEELLRLVSSANIACGFHGGDPGVMRRTVEAAKREGVSIGAHPGLPDLSGFGRRSMDVSPQEVYDIVVYQIGALSAFAAAAGVSVRHVKPHGALYNMAARDRALSDAIARAVRDVDAELLLFGLAGSVMLEAASNAGIRGVSEVFADRNYSGDGSLVSRRRDDAMLKDAGAVSERTVRMVKEGLITTVDGNDISVRADTICIHGDGPHALEFASTVKLGMQAAGIEIRSL